MKKHLLLTLLPIVLCAAFAACTPNASTPVAETGPAQTKVDSVAAAAVNAAGVANSHNPDGPAKVATAGEITIAKSALPEPSDKDRADALARINLALQGKVDAYAAEAATATAAAKTAKGELDAERGKSSAALAALAEELRHERLTKLALIFGGLGALLIVAGSAAALVSVFVSDVDAVASKLKLASGVLGGAGFLTGSIPIFWDSDGFPWACGALFALGLVAGIYLLREAWKTAKQNKDAVRASVAQTVTESALAHDTLLKLAGQIDALKKSDPDAAKALTDKLAVTFDSDNEDLIKDLRAESLKAS